MIWSLRAYPIDRAAVSMLWQEAIVHVRVVWEALGLLVFSDQDWVNYGNNTGRREILHRFPTLLSSFVFFRFRWSPSLLVLRRRRVLNDKGRRVVVVVVIFMIIVLSWLSSSVISETILELLLPLLLLNRLFVPVHHRDLRRWHVGAMSLWVVVILFDHVTFWGNLAVISKSITIIATTSCEINL